VTESGAQIAANEVLLNGAARRTAVSVESIGVVALFVAQNESVSADCSAQSLVVWTDSEAQ
jgi:hypothetical protein